MGVVSVAPDAYFCTHVFTKERRDESHFPFAILALVGYGKEIVAERLAFRYIEFGVYGAQLRALSRGDAPDVRVRSKIRLALYH